MLWMLRENWRAVDMIHGPVMSVISKCLRGLLVPAPGHRLVGGDFANVEGRGVAWFAGEDWKLAAFRAYDAGTGPDLYKLAYAKSFGVSVDSVDKGQRQIGKVEELAFGYGGGKGAFAMMGAVFGINVPEAQADEFKRLWREAHPATVNVWRALERAAIAAVLNPGNVYSAGHPDRAVKFKMVGTFLWCLLPSGRTLCYAYPKILEGAYGPQLTYFTVPSTNDIKRGTLIDDPANTNKWARVATYGGSLLENVIQAICRDLLAWCMTELEAAGLPVVLHVHDEIVCEVPTERAEAASEIMQRTMNSVPLWAMGFPLTAECSVMERYGK
jgi:DNA polymerase